jgi:hypothetical protein
VGATANNTHAFLALTKDYAGAGVLFAQRITRIPLIIRFIRVIRWLQFLPMKAGAKWNYRS